MCALPTGVHESCDVGTISPTDSTAAKKSRISSVVSPTCHDAIRGSGAGGEISGDVLTNAERGEVREHTKEWKAEFLDRLRKQFERLEKVPHGNLLLPEKLHLFVL